MTERFVVVRASVLLLCSLASGCYLSHGRSSESEDAGVAIDAAPSVDARSGIDALPADAGRRDAPLVCRDHELDRRLIPWSDDHCARTGDESWERFEKDCECDSDCVLGGCGLDICYDRRMTPRGGTCDCVSPAGGVCGCVRGRCAWYDTRDPGAPCATEGEECFERRCCEGLRCHIGICR